MANQDRLTSRALLKIFPCPISQAHDCILDSSISWVRRAREFLEVVMIPFERMPLNALRCIKTRRFLWYEVALSYD